MLFLCQRVVMVWFGTEPGESLNAEMVDVPNPDKVADLIMSRLRANNVT